MGKILIPATAPEDWKGFLAQPDKHWKRGFSAKAREEVHRVCTLGVPLVAITNADALEERIIRPLLASLPGSAAGLAP